MAVKNGMPDDVLGGLYPFEDKYVTLGDGTQMHYIEMGRAGLRRPTFLLVHGNPAWSFLWRDFMKPLAKIGRVIAIDHIGMGRSDHPTDGEYHSLQHHIDNLEDFCRAKKLKRVIPVLHDWGGPIGLGYAVRNPGDLAGLVLINTWAFTERAEMRIPLPFKAIRSRLLADRLLRRRAIMLDWLERELEDAPEAVGAAYRHPFTNEESRAALLRFPQMIPDSPKHPDWWTMDAIDRGLDTLDVPALLLFQEDDPIFPAEFAWAFHEALPRAEQPVFLPETGHFMQESVPDLLVERIVDWAR